MECRVNGREVPESKGSGERAGQWFVAMLQKRLWDGLRSNSLIVTSMYMHANNHMYLELSCCFIPLVTSIEMKTRVKSTQSTALVQCCGRIALVWLKITSVPRAFCNLIKINNFGHPTWLSEMNIQIAVCLVRCVIVEKLCKFMNWCSQVQTILINPKLNHVIPQLSIKIFQLKKHFN